MKFLRSISPFACVAFVLAAAPLAHADIILDSGVASVFYTGSNTLAANAPFNAANPYSFITSNSPALVANLGTNPGTWTAAIPGSYWISNNAGSAPGGSYIAPNGYYTYTTTFSATAGIYDGSIDLMADDTVAVFLNGSSTPLVLAGAIGGDSKCADYLPNCTTVDSVGLSNLDLNSSNTLTFVVEQTGSSAEGLDFAANLAPVPEPGTLWMLGTGFLGLAGAARRKFAR